jgi:hypothetical protein
VCRPASARRHTARRRAPQAARRAELTLPGRVLAAPRKAPYTSPRLSALRLAVQDAALSRRKHGFDSRRARQLNQWVTPFGQRLGPKSVQYRINRCLSRTVLLSRIAVPDVWVYDKVPAVLVHVADFIDALWQDQRRFCSRWNSLPVYDFIAREIAHENGRCLWCSSNFAQCPSIRTISPRRVRIPV